MILVGECAAETSFSAVKIVGGLVGICVVMCVGMAWHYSSHAAAWRTAELGWDVPVQRGELRVYSTGLFDAANLNSQSQ
jgi:hypothetical protein